MEYITILNKIYDSLEIKIDNLEDCVFLWDFSDIKIDQLKKDMKLCLENNKKLNKAYIIYLKTLQRRNNELANNIINFVENSKTFKLIPYQNKKDYFEIVNIN